MSRKYIYLANCCYIYIVIAIRRHTHTIITTNTNSYSTTWLQKYLIAYSKIILVQESQLCNAHKLVDRILLSFWPSPASSRSTLESLVSWW